MPSVEIMQMHLEGALGQLQQDDPNAAGELIPPVKRTLQYVVAYCKQGYNVDQLTKTGQLRLREYLEHLRRSQLQTQLAGEEEDFSAVLEKATTDLATIKAVEEGRFEVPFPEGTSIEAPKFEATFIDFVDELCGGGLANGEIVGHSAPVGSGKTTLILQLAWARISRLLSKYKRVPLDQVPWEELPHIYLFVYEPVRNLLVNYISNAANIERETALRFWTSGSDLSILSSRERRDYKKHELAFLGPAIEEAKKNSNTSWPNGELERLQWVTAASNRLLSIVDFSGENPALAEWAGMGVIGIRNYLEAHQQREKNRGVDIALVDYVGAMIDTQISVNNLRLSDRANHIRMAPGDLVREVAAKFSCPVWAAHQLNSQENARSGGTIPDPSKNDGSGMFLERCTIGFASGKLTRENVAVYVHAKQRRGTLLPPKVIALDRRYAQWSAKLAEGYAISSGQVLRSDEISKSATSKGFVPMQQDAGF